MADIIGFGGKLSGGKSVTAVSYLIDDYEKGKKIVSNIPLYGLKEYTFIESEDLATFIISNYKNQKEIEKRFFNASLFIDEARNLLSARKSNSNLNEIITQFLMMLGKLDCNFYYTYQIFGSQIDIQLREITHNLIECKRVDKNGNPYFGPRKAAIKIYIHCIVWEIVEGGLKEAGQYYYDPEPFFKYYNTREFVIVDREKYLKR